MAAAADAGKPNFDQVFAFWVQVVQYLLANNYLLTALELLLEAQEAGREGEMESLQQYFADHDRFPPEEVVKLGPADGETLIVSCISLYIFQESIACQ